MDRRGRKIMTLRIQHAKKMVLKGGMYVKY
jgi:hypothetical protein